MDARWGWLQTDPEFQLAGDDWTSFRNHVVALTVPAASLPEPLRLPHWRASAAVNLPDAINNRYSLALNGFDARCVACACSLAVLSETLFPGAAGAAALEFPENYIPRRDW